MAPRFFRRWMCTLFLFLGLLGVSAAYAAPISQGDAETSVYVYIFWGEGCPHCEVAKPFLEALTQRYSQIEVIDFEVYKSQENQALFGAMASAHGFEPRYVPTIFVGEQHWEGYSSLLRDDIERGITACVESGCPDAGVGIVPGHEAQQASTVDQPAKQTSDAAITVYLFWGDAGCHNCVATQTHHATASGFTQFDGDGGGEALVFLRALVEAHPDVELQAYEVWISSTNRPRFRDVAKAYDIEARGVPTIYAGDRFWEGFDKGIAAEIEAYVVDCLDVGCSGPAAEAKKAPTQTISPSAMPTEVAAASTEPTPVASDGPASTPGLTALLIFGSALLAALLVLVIYRRLPPKIGMLLNIIA
jgi:glutaredoxin